MDDDAAAFLAKAEECLAGAESEYGARRYNNAANRCYYACFHAAIQALILADIRPRGLRGQWGHDFVQAEFVGQLINRRKHYHAGLRDLLMRAVSLRQTADYGVESVTELETARMLRRVRDFLAVVRSRGR